MIAVYKHQFWISRSMKIAKISDEFFIKNCDAGVEDAASKQILMEKSPKDSNFHGAPYLKLAFTILFVINHPSLNLKKRGKVCGY